MYRPAPPFNVAPKFAIGFAEVKDSSIPLILVGKPPGKSFNG